MKTHLDLEQRETGTLSGRGTFSMVGLAGQGIARFFTTLVIGRLAGPAVLGTMSAAMSTAQFLALAWPSTTGSAASKFIARARGRADSGELYAVATHLSRRMYLSASILATLAVPTWMLIDHGGIWDGIWVGVLVLGYAAQSLARGLHFGSGQVERSTRWDVATTLAGLVGLVILLLLGSRGALLLAPLAVGNMLFLYVSRPARAGSNLPKDARREIDVFVALGTTGTLSSAGLVQLAMVAARITGGASGAGQFAAALALASPLAMVAGAMGLVLYPSMSAAHGRGDTGEIARIADRATRLLALLLMGLLGIMILCSRLIVHIAWGDRYSPAGDMLPLMLAAIMLTSIGVPSVNSLTSGAQSGMVATTVASVLGLFTGLVAWLAFAPTLGVFGIALGYFLGAALTAIAVFVVAWRRRGQSWSDLALRVAAGLTLLGLCAYVQRVWHLSVWLDPAWAACFLGLWIIANRQAAAALRRRAWASVRLRLRVRH